MEKTPAPASTPLSNMFLGDSQGISSTFLGATDEYEPLHPNDYEDYVKILKDRRQREREDERKKEMEERER